MFCDLVSISWWYLLKRRKRMITIITDYLPIQPSSCPCASAWPRTMCHITPPSNWYSLQSTLSFPTAVRGYPPPPDMVSVDTSDWGARYQRVTCALVSFMKSTDLSRVWLKQRVKVPQEVVSEGEDEPLDDQTIPSCLCCSYSASSESPAR